MVPGDLMPPFLTTIKKESFDMVKHRAAIGLSLLSALVFCAFAAQSASAAVAKNTTAFTCIPEPNGKGDFEDAHCDKTHPKKEGKFTHSLITNAKTLVDSSNQKVTNETKNSEPAVFKGTVFTLPFQIECSEVTATSELSNEEPAAKEHKIKFAKNVYNFSKCTASKPAKCTAPKEPIIGEASGEGVEGLEGPKGEANAMGIEFKGSKAEEGFVEITFPKASNPECPIAEKPFVISGSMIATSGPTTESGQNGKESGATLVFTPKFKMQLLRVSLATAEFSTILTPTMTNGTTTENPISTTTTT